MNILSAVTTSNTPIVIKHELTLEAEGGDPKMADAQTEEKAKEPKIEVDEEDEEVKLAMEMAMAAIQHPHLSPAELRKLVGEKNKQSKIVEEAEAKVQKKKEEQAAKEWEAQKQAAYNWFNTKAEDAAKYAAEKAWEAEKQYYAEDIKKDEAIIKIRKRMKVCKKTLKAHRLQGNRVETRHTFKRTRMEKKLLAINDKIRKNQKLLTHTGFNVQEYAKAMMKASKKWKKKGSKEEISLEAQLCRNMHQMLAIEKQKAKLHKGSREIKKYMQRCKSWLSDKKAFCEMHLMTLDATASSMRILYQDTLSKQDALIRKLSQSEEFEGVDFGDVDLSGFQELEQVPGPSAMLNALRGLPIQDSVRLKKEEGELLTSAVQAAVAADDTEGPELYIEAKDDDSVSSHLTDDGNNEVELPIGDDDEESESEDFGVDAPWNRPVDLEDDAPAEGKEKKKKRKPKTEKVSEAPAPAEQNGEVHEATPKTAENGDAKESSVKPVEEPSTEKAEKKSESTTEVSESANSDPADVNPAGETEATEAEVAATEE